MTVNRTVYCGCCPLISGYITGMMTSVWKVVTDFCVGLWCVCVCVCVCVRARVRVRACVRVLARARVHTCPQGQDVLCIPKVSTTHRTLEPDPFKGESKTICTHVCLVLSHLALPKTMSVSLQDAVTQKRD